jgi:hypothetical protein
VATLTMIAPTMRPLNAICRLNFLMDSPAPIKVNCSKQVWDDQFLGQYPVLQPLMIADAVDVLLLSLEPDDEQPQHETALRIGDGGARMLS